MSGQIKVGKRVRSFDFDGRRDCYVDGVLEGYEVVEGCERYVIRVQSRVFAGKTANIGPSYVYPPVNLTPTTMGYLTRGVEEL